LHMYGTPHPSSSCPGRQQPCRRHHKLSTEHRSCLRQHCMPYPQKSQQNTWCMLQRTEWGKECSKNVGRAMRQGWVKPSTEEARDRESDRPSQRPVASLAKKPRPQLVADTQRPSFLAYLPTEHLLHVVLVSQDKHPAGHVVKQEIDTMYGSLSSQVSGAIRIRSPPGYQIAQTSLRSYVGP